MTKPYTHYTVSNNIEAIYEFLILDSELNNMNNIATLIDAAYQIYPSDNPYYVVSN